jgi:hypothetical protein
VPTPTASDHIERECTSRQSPLNFETMKSVSLDRWARMWPTPRAAMTGGATPERCNDKFRNLETAVARVMWPTPTTRDWKDGDAHSCRNVPVNALLGRAIHEAVRFPTPQARDSHNRSGQADRYLIEKRWNLQDRNAADGITGSLNPAWVEILMGLPLGWTDVSK